MTEPRISGSGNTAIVAIVVIVLIAVVAIMFFLFRGAPDGEVTEGPRIELEFPREDLPAPGQ